MTKEYDPGYLASDQVIKLEQRVQAAERRVGLLERKVELLVDLVKDINQLLIEVREAAGGS